MGVRHGKRHCAVARFFCAPDREFVWEIVFECSVVSPRSFCLPVDFFAPLVGMHFAFARGLVASIGTRAAASPLRASPRLRTEYFRWVYFSFNLREHLIFTCPVEWIQGFYSRLGRHLRTCRTG